jgi:negative regulator of flagellin synthesis FlgM
VKIEGMPKPVGGSGTAETRPRAPASPAPGRQGDGATVALSPLSSSLGKAEAAMASTPVVNRERVEEIRKAISEGRFQVDASRIADGLIHSVREMLAAQSGRS